MGGFLPDQVPVTGFLTNWKNNIDYAKWLSAEMRSLFRWTRKSK